MAKVRTRQRITIGLVFGGVLVLAGCADGPSTPAVSPRPLAIVTQPLSQTAPIGSTATFTVTATGTAPLSFKWSENGAEISGATSASYTTPSVALGPGGSISIGTFEVTVSDKTGSVTSKSATLTAGPRSPKAGDLRYLLFQQVDGPNFLTSGGGGGGYVDFEVGGNIGAGSASNALGTPLGMGSTAACQVGSYCVWPYAYAFLPSPSGFQMYYQGGEYSSFTSDLQGYAAPNVVFTSLDLEPAENAYAVSWVQTSQMSSFDYRIDPLVSAGSNQAAQIQSQAVLDGTESRVITAVSFDASGNAILISYGWTGDTTTGYESQTKVVAPGNDVSANVLSAATALANGGYVISAFGGNDLNGYILIGMRVQGDSLSRPILAVKAPFNVTNGPPYLTTVAYLFELSANHAPVDTIINEQ